MRKLLMFGLAAGLMAASTLADAQYYRRPLAYQYPYYPAPLAYAGATPMYVQPVYYYGPPRHYGLYRPAPMYYYRYQR